MLSLLFVYALAANASAPMPASHDDARASCKNIDNCRTLLNIVWSCITTIFLCTWATIHPNIPEPIDTTRMSLFRQVILFIRRFISDRLPLFICALLVPEYILAWAIRQYLVARALGKENQFSTTHGFFIVMGGFHYFKPRQPALTGSSDTTSDLELDTPLLERKVRFKSTTDGQEIPVHPLDPDDVVSMLEDRVIILPTEDEIKDKSQSDWIAKSIVLLQTIWFIIQCIARRYEHFPTTELELAYTAVNFGIFIAWWDKPKSVDCPVRVSQAPPRTKEKEVPDWVIISKAWIDIIGNSIAGALDLHVDIHRERKVPMFYGGDARHDHTVTADMITLLVGVVFGAIHCIAWSFEFPSYIEALLWRISSVVITAVPAYLLLVLSTIFLFRGLSSSGFKILIIFQSLCALLFGVLYVAARLTTLVLAFVNLVSSPPGVFRAVHWTTRIPHL